MIEGHCGLAAETKVETPEGALTVRGLAGKNVSVFTREPEGRVRFRRMTDVRSIGADQPLLRVTLEGGASFRVAPCQVLYKKGMVEARADELKPGDELVPVFHYKEGYEYREDRDGTTSTSSESIKVAAVVPGGNGEVFAFGVNQTGNFFLSAGVLCKAGTTEQ
jgi:hypothetical protein